MILIDFSRSYFVTYIKYQYTIKGLIEYDFIILR